MTLSRTRSLLADLKLPGMNTRLDWVLDEVRRHNWTIEEALDALLQAESDFRKQRGIRSRLRASRIKGQARFEDYDFTAPRSLSKVQFKEISSLSWLLSGRPLVLIGQTGAQSRKNERKVSSWRTPSLPDREQAFLPWRTPFDSSEAVSLLRDTRAVFTPPPERSQALSRFRMESPLRVIV